MLYVALRMARHRIAALLAVACAALGGGAFVTAIGVVAESGWRSHAPVGRLAGADVVVSASQTFRPAEDLPIALPERTRIPAELVDRLARLSGVTAAIGDVSFPAAVLDARGRPVPAGDPRTAGHGWSSTALLAHPRTSGAAPTSPLDVAVDGAVAAAAGVGPGDQVTVVAAGQRGVYRVSAVVGDARGGVFFADATASRLAGRAQGTVDLVGLRTAPGAAGRVAAAARDLVRGTGMSVSTGRARGDVEVPAAAAARGALPPLAGSMAGVTLLIVGFIVGGALTVSIAAQRRDLALMRAVGATPRQVRRLIAAQATIVAVAALGPGVAAGYLLAERFRRLLVSAGLLPPALPLSISPLPAVAAALLLVAVVLVSAWCAALRTSRMPATEAVAESRSEPRKPSRWRGLAGVVVLVGANALAVAPLLVRSQVGAAVTALAGIIATVGLALAGPSLVNRISGAAQRRLGAGASAPTWLAMANSHGYPRRAAAAVTTLAMAVVFTLTYTMTQTTVLAASTGDLRDGARAQVRVSAPGFGGVPDDLAAAVTATPGVLATAPVTSTTVLWPYRLLGEPEVEAAPALVLTPAARSVLDLDVRAGDLAGLTGDTVAVDVEAAKSRNASVGREIELVLGDGTRVTARVVAVYARGFGFGPVVLSRDLAAGHTTTALDQSLLVRTDGTDATGRNLAALVASHPGLVLDRAAPAPDDRGTIPTELWINVAVLGFLLGYLLLGIANKLIATTAARRTELAALQLVGATPRQLRSMMRREAALICAIAFGTGALLSVLPLGFLGVGLLHRPWPAGPVWLLPAVGAVVAGIAFLSIELPTRRALRTPPAYALKLD